MRSGNAARIVITCVGSLGDLHPYLAIGVELARRGHHPVIATTESFRSHVTAAGLPFHRLRAVTTETASTELIRRVFSGRKGVEYIIRQLIVPALRTAYVDTLVAAESADLLIGHPLTFATPLVAGTRGLPWISTQLAPTGMLSVYDPPVLPGLEWVHRLRPSPAAYRVFFRLADCRIRRWLAPYDQLRRELQLPDIGNPLFAGGHAPLRELALFSSVLGAPQRDWPSATVVTGFPFFDQPGVPFPALENFLRSGPPPVVFTLGSSAVMDAGNFFRESALAARQLGQRALLLGVDPAAAHAWLESNSASGATPTDVFACAYASYAEIFPRAAAIIHQGGVGTTAEALRAGRPMLVVPFGADQPDNASRIARLGVGRVLGRRQYKAKRVAQELRSLLEIAGYRTKAEQVRLRVLAENGTGTACDLIEAQLPSSAATLSPNFEAALESDRALTMKGMP